MWTGSGIGIPQAGAWAILITYIHYGNYAPGDRRWRGSRARLNQSVRICLTEGPDFQVVGPRGSLEENIEVDMVYYMR